MSEIKPTKKQLDFLNWEFGLFFHFGIRSFYPGHQDFDGLPMPAEAFNPTELDCEQWIRAGKEAGATYAILTAKHHDGFCNWPSQYSDYTVASTPYKNGHGDVVKEFVDACRKYDFKVGIYYSPAQWGGNISFDNPKEYDDYFINQISELLTNYGEIHYLWFDACGSENHEYDKDRIIQTIRTLQPNILIFSMWDPDTRWVGNEDGYADMPNINVVDAVDFSVNTTEKKSVNQLMYLPAEVNTKIRTTWFDSEPNEHTIRTLDELIGNYEYSVGRGGNFLLNIGPNAKGLLPEPDVKRLLEFGQAIKERYGHPLAFGDLEDNGENEYIIKTPDVRFEWNPSLQGSMLVNTVIIEEDITQGEAIEEFRLYTHLPVYGSKRICVFKGDNVGHKRICRFPTIKTGAIVLEVTKKSGDVVLRSMKAYYAK